MWVMDWNRTSVSPIASRSRLAPPVDATASLLSLWPPYLPPPGAATMPPRDAGSNGERPVDGTARRREWEVGVAYGARTHNLRSHKSALTRSLHNERYTD